MAGQVRAIHSKVEVKLAYCRIIKFTRDEVIVEKWMGNVNGDKKFFVGLILLFAIILSACENSTPVVYIPIPTSTFTATQTLRPLGDLFIVLTPLRTPSPTKNVTPTATITPTGTITPTLIPGALDCNIINSNHVVGITDLQWSTYTGSVIGKKSYFSGVVNNVDIKGEVNLAATDQQCIFVLSKIPLAQAMKISINQFMEGYGTISSIKYDKGVIIHVDVLLDSLIIH